mmetsp:Transcript_26620/g.49721  ORF Transcript_26620/g.49721 Transcript_26620/m.49721 type:complete len:189 (-) Transcript_26620:1785-2351(-)
MPFLLNPNMSNEGEGMLEHLTKKYGPSAAERFHDPDSPLKVMGRKVGIEFNNDRKVVDTKKAHALMEYIKEQCGNDKANQFMEDLFHAYLEEGKDINDETMLVETAVRNTNDNGISADDARRAMGPDHVKQILIQDRQNKYKYGVSGVPFFMIHPNNNDDDNSRPVAFSGAYPVEVIAEQLQEAAGEN